jgi:Family of unknown function (DUF6141)
MKAMSSGMESRPAYREAQRFRQWWIWLTLAVPTGLVWYGAFRPLVLGESWGDRPASEGVLLILWLLFGVGLPALFLSLKLVTEVREDGIYIRFIPFHLRFQRIAFSEVEQAEARKYRPIVEYGGWGIRYGLFGKGKAYNVSGNRGVQLVLKGGKRLLIGSQRSEEFCRAIHSQWSEWKSLRR